MKEEKNSKIIIPQGTFCGHNCTDGCIYWNPYKRDNSGRQYCERFGHYYYPHERQGCLRFNDGTKRED